MMMQSPWLTSSASDSLPFIRSWLVQSANVRKEMVLAPEAFKERLWWNEDMLIVICRRMKLKSVKPESKDGVPALSVLSALSRTNSIEGSAAETPRAALPR